jgi:hypothetical protein
MPVESCIQDALKSAIRPFSNVPAFDPLTLTPDALFDNTDAANLYQDEGRTSVVTAVNDPVASATDLTTNQRHISIDAGQTTDRPLYNGDGLLFDGVNDFMSNDWGSGNDISQPVTHVISFQFIVAGQLDYLIDGTRGTHNQTVYIDNSTPNEFAAATSVAASTGLTADTDPHVISVEFNGAASNIWMDGALVAENVDLGTEGWIGFSWGALFTGAQNFSNVIISKHFVKQGTLSSADRASVEGWADVNGVL